MNLHKRADHESTHEAAQQALPWVANGSLQGAELDGVEAHLANCAACRGDLALLRTLHAAAAQPGRDPAAGCDPERALARLLPRLDDAMPARPEPRPPAPAPATGLLRRWRERLAANDGAWLRRAVLLQAGAIVVLLGLLARPLPGPGGAPAADRGDYRALGAGAPVQASVVVMFQPDTAERELRRIVRAGGGRIVGGPTAADAWLVEADAWLVEAGAGNGDAAALAARLRAEPAVLMAEPLGPERRP